MRKWLDGCIKSLVVNVSMSRWRPVTGGLHWDFIFSLVTWAVGWSPSLAKVVDTKLRGVVTEEERAAIHI